MVRINHLSCCKAGSSSISVPTGCSITLRARAQGRTELISSGDGIFTVYGDLTMYELQLSGPAEVAASASLVSVHGGSLKTFRCTFRDNDICGSSAAGDGEGSGKAPCSHVALTVSGVQAMEEASIWNKALPTLV